MSTWYKFTITGKSNEDGKFYIATSESFGMSEDELDEWIKELNFEKDTVKFDKVKIK